MANFDISFKKLLKWEGGYSNNPNDSGGSTNFGITQNSWNDFIKKWPNKSPKTDVSTLNDLDADQFYFLEYWLPLKLFEVESQPVADVILSFAVNQGKATAVKRLQNILQITADGIIGPNTLAVINAADPKYLVNKFCLATSAFYDALVKSKLSDSIFLNGWKHRVADYVV